MTITPMNSVYTPCRRLLPLVVLMLSAGASVRADSPFAFRQISSTALELSEDGKPVFDYNFGPTLAPGFPESMRRSTYIHPVYAPDGTVLSDDFNKNHPHHRGIFWAWEWVTVNGKKDDIWTVKGYRQRFVRWKARETSPTSARLAVENGWYDHDKRFAKEDVEILVHPVEGRQRVMEFTLRFEAVSDPVTIEGTHDGQKGYGGFAFRFATPDGGGANTVITTDKGVSPKDGVMSRHPWAQISGVYKGRSGGARIEDDPSNPGYPDNGWLMRHELCLLNCSYPGLHPLVLEPGKPLVLKYRVVLFSGNSPVASR